MAWTHVQTFAPEALPREGWYRTKHECSDGTASVCVIVKWDHSPTVNQRTIAVTRILDFLNNPPPQPTTKREIKATLIAIRDSNQTNAQKLTALANFIDAIVGDD